MKKLFLLTFLISIYTISNAQYLLVEKYEPKDIHENGQQNIVKTPYSKYTFDNGLTLIISEDHSNPLVNVNITYKVGSANDYSDRTGMAYMIYKLMDKGSRHLANGEYQSTIKSYGGKSFSQITRDRTTFSTTVPKNILSTILWMESDRQAYFLDSLTPQKFDNAKLDIIADMYDSLYHQKYGLPDVLAQKNTYVFGHPYTWPEFGMMDHYQAFSLTDLKMYYLDWYGSNNTIITIMGDVTTQDAVNLVNTYFGTLTKAPKSQANMDDLFSRIAGPGSVDVTEPRYISYKIDVPYPLVKIVFNTVPKGNKDEKLLNLIASLFGQGKNSVLYNELVKKGYAVSVNAAHKTFKYTGEFSIDVKANPDTSLAVIVTKINSIIQDIAHNRNIAAYVQSGMNNPVILNPTPQQNVEPIQAKPQQPGNQAQTKNKQKPQPPKANQQAQPAPPAHQMPQEMPMINREELAMNHSKSGEVVFQTMAKFKINEISQFQSLQNRGMALAEMEFLTGNPSNISTTINGYDDNSPERFYEVFNMYMSTGAKLYVSIVSKDKENQIAGRDNIIERDLKTVLTPAQEKDLAYRYPVKEINSKKPKVIDMSYSPDLKIKTDTARNGMIVSMVQSNSYPMVSFNIRLDASGIMKLMPKMDVPAMLAYKYTEWLEMQGMDNPLKAIAITGSKIEFLANTPFIDMHITCLPEHLMIVKESILLFFTRPDYNLSSLFPQFMQKTGDTVLQKSFRNQEKACVIKTLSGGNLSDNSDSIDGEKMGGKSPQNRKKLTAALLSMNSPKHIQAIAYGNIDEGIYIDFYNRLSIWDSPEFPDNHGAGINPDSVNINNLKIQAEGNIFFLQTDNKESATIVVEYMQIPAEISTNYYTGKLANYMFGMAAANQLSKNLSGMDYILKVKTISYFRNKMECYAVIVDVKSDKLYDGYSNIFKELDNFKTFKPDKAYFASVKKEYLYTDIVNMETFSQKERVINNLISYKIDPAIINNQYAKTKKIKASHISKFWKASYNKQNQRIVVIGDESKLQTDLKKTGNNIVKIDKTGTVIN